jgi:hypothetical protein
MTSPPMARQDARRPRVHRDVHAAPPGHAHRSGPARGGSAPSAFPIVIRFWMALLDGRAGLLTAQKRRFPTRAVMEQKGEAAGCVSHEPWSHFHAPLYVFISILQTNQTGRHENSFTAHGYRLRRRPDLVAHRSGPARAPGAVEHPQRFPW